MQQDTPINSAMGGREWATLAALSVLWGGSFLFVGVAVRELPPLTIVLLRVGIAAAALHGVLRVTRVPLPRDGRTWAAFACMGLLNNALPFTLIVWAQGHIPSGVASIFNATTPLFGVLVAHVWTSDEKITPGRLAGVVIGFAGVAVMIGGAAVAALRTDLLAQAAMLGAALLYAVSGVYGRRFKTLGVAPLATAAGMLTAATILLLPAALVIDRPWRMEAPEAATVAAILGLALLATALAFILYFRLLATAGATNLLLVTLLIPVSAILFGAAILGERLAPAHFFGMALIGLGLAAIDGRPLAAARRRLSARGGAAGLIGGDPRSTPEDRAGQARRREGPHMTVQADLCGDDELAYERSRTHFAPGAGLVLDETYRLAHLPLVNPDHHGVIPAKDGTDYRMGRHGRVFSLVLPVPDEALRRSPAYGALDRDLRAAPFAGKIAWPLLDRRAGRLHATLCGSLSTGRPPPVAPEARRALAALGPVAVEVRGLFSGNVNRGRLYLRVYPEKRSGANVFHLVQGALGRPTTGLYVVGVWNLTDDLDPGEAAALRDLIARWWNRPILRFAADRLWLLGAEDDLVLGGSVAEVLPLTANADAAAGAFAP